MQSSKDVYRKLAYHGECLFVYTDGLYEVESSDVCDGKFC